MTSSPGRGRLRGQEAEAEAVRRSQQTRGRPGGQEVTQLGEAAPGPGVASGGVSPVTHDVSCTSGVTN